MNIRSGHNKQEMQVFCEPVLLSEHAAGQLFKEQIYVIPITIQV